MKLALWELVNMTLFCKPCMISVYDSMVYDEVREAVTADDFDGNTAETCLFTIGSEQDFVLCEFIKEKYSKALVTGVIINKRMYVFIDVKEDV